MNGICLVTSARPRTGIKTFSAWCRAVLLVRDDAVLIPGKEHPAQGHQVVHDGIEVGFLLLRFRQMRREWLVALTTSPSFMKTRIRPFLGALPRPHCSVSAQRDLDRARPLPLASGRRTLEGFIHENRVHGLSGSGFPDPALLQCREDSAVPAELLVETGHGEASECLRGVGQSDENTAPAASQTRRRFILMSPSENATVTYPSRRRNACGREERSLAVESITLRLRNDPRPRSTCDNAACHADQLLLHPARRQAEGLGQGVPDAARGDQGGRDRRRQRPATDRQLLLPARAPRWSRTRPSSTSSTAPSPPTSRASSCSPTSPRRSRSSGCRRSSSSSSAPRRRPQIEKMGWDELMETLKKRFEEQKERHEGGNKMIGTGGTSPVRRLRLQPAGHPHRPGQGPQQERGQGLGPAPVQGLRRHARARHAQHQDRAAPPAPLRPRRLGRGARPRRHDPRRPPPTPAGSTSRWCPSGTTR